MDILKLILVTLAFISFFCGCLFPPKPGASVLFHPPWVVAIFFAVGSFLAVVYEGLLY
ncbi:hypothetical protein [Pseudomonas sp. 460]|uniref:hypothetical protein n=1 Tax=Pseudomonas sp. 460 TaxID=2485142 RepID=UPI0010DE8FE7|nr:hypothetical protein [Pseudomonas sp. 460]TCV51424.1 hypothetical protein EDB99_10790 [Pseudomonas sp. 460]